MYHIPHESQSEGLEQVQASLEYAVVQAALAERRAIQAVHRWNLYGKIEGAERVWHDAVAAYEAAADALLAFLGEN